MRRRVLALARDHPVFAAIGALTAGILLFWLPIDFVLRQHDVVTPFGFNDFGAYTGAVDRWEAGEIIYEADEAGGYHGSYLYPPVTLLVFVPFATFDFYPGAILFSVVSLILLWVGLEAVVRRLGYAPGVGERLLGLVALLSFQPALRDFKWAQTASLLAAAFCFAFYCQELAINDRLSRGYRLASGALTTLGSAVKLHYAPAGAHLLRDRYRLAGAFGMLGLLAIGSFWVFGLENHETYLDVLTWGKGWGERTPSALWDTSSAYYPLHVFGGVSLPLRALGVIAAIALAILGRRSDSRQARLSTFALGVAAIPILAPAADSHDLVLVLLPAVILTAVEFEHSDGRPWLPVLAVLLVHLHRYVIEVLINHPEWLPASEFVSANVAWFQPAMWGTFLLLGLAVYRLIEAADVAELARENAAGDATRI